MAKRISTEELDRAFDNGESIVPHMDRRTMQMCEPNEVRKVNVDMPVWMIEGLDREATRLGVSRQAVIKTMLDRELAAIG